MSKHGEYFILEQQIKDAVRIFSEEAEKIANTKLEIFQTILANPGHSLADHEKQHLEDHARKLCAISGMINKIKECKKENPVDDPVFLRSAIKQISRGVFDHSEAASNPDLTRAALQKKLVTEFSAQLSLLEFGNNYDEINALNIKVKDFRKAALSLYAELSEQIEAFEKQHPKEEGKQTYKQVPEAFKQKKESINEDSNNAQAVALYTYSEAEAISPSLHNNPNVGSQEAIDNLKTTGYFYADSIMGSLQVNFVSKFIIPTAVNAICTVKKSQQGIDATKDSNFALSNAFEHLEYITENFQTIFQGFNTDYYSKIMLTLQKIQDIRVPTAGSLDISEFTKGMHSILAMNQHVKEQQGAEYKAPNLEEMIAESCPQFEQSHQLLLGAPGHFEHDEG